MGPDGGRAYLQAKPAEDIKRPGHMAGIGHNQQPPPFPLLDQGPRQQRIADGVARPVLHHDPIRKNAGGQGHVAHDMGFGHRMAHRAATHQQVADAAGPGEGEGVADSPDQGRAGAAVGADHRPEHDGGVETIDSGRGHHLIIISEQWEERMDKRRNSDVMVETLALEGKRVIDVGCGDGALVRLMTRFGAKVLGVECSPRQLGKARTAEAVGDEEIVDGVGQSLPAADGSADLVVFFNSLHHIPIAFQAKAMAEAARVLKVGGEVYVSEPLPFGPFFEAVRPIDDETWVRGAALAAVKGAWSHGLEEISEFSYLHPMVMPDYEAFREKIISANAERESRFAELDTQMREAFARLAQPAEDGGFAFEQPMRINLLRKN